VHEETGEHVLKQDGKEKVRPPCKGRDWRLGYIFSSCTIVCSILVVTAATYVDEPSHPCRRQVLHLMTQWRRQACCRQVLHTMAPIYGGAGSSSHAC
jgi:hypothetical protein